MRKAGGLITLLHPPDAQKQSARSGGSRRWHSHEDAWSNVPLAGDGRAGDVADFAAADAEVVEFACGHTTQFSDRLTVLAPVGFRSSAASPWRFVRFDELYII
jgi:hypothetical protein